LGVRMRDWFYADGIYGKRGRKIELDDPSDAVPMIAEYLASRYEVYEWLGSEDGGEWARMPLRFRHRDYDRETGYVMLVDCWGETVAEVLVICREYKIYWSWVEHWAEKLFEICLLPMFERSPYFEWDWKDRKPGMAARVWSMKTLLEVYRRKAESVGGAWKRRYVKLLSDFLERKRPKK